MATGCLERPFCKIVLYLEIGIPTERSGVGFLGFRFSRTNKEHHEKQIHSFSFGAAELATFWTGEPGANHYNVSLLN